MIVEIQRFITVRFQKEGFHYWPKPSEKRAYLGHSHRHLFYVEVSLEVFQNDREVEFHDFLDFCKAGFEGGEMGAQSCETMSETLLNKIAAQYPERQIKVSIFEDGEVGAGLYFIP